MSKIKRFLIAFLIVIGVFAVPVLYIVFSRFYPLCALIIMSGLLFTGLLLLIYQALD